MKNTLIILLVSCVTGLASAAAKPAAPTAVKTVYKLKYTEDFKGTKLNPKLWKRIDRGNPDWCKNMSLREDLVTLKGGIVSLHGIRNDGADPAETRRVLTGGIMTKDLFAMKYGKVEIKLKLEDGQRGAWPAVWMMPQNPAKGWPTDGEIDIVERLNSDNFVYQTVHFGNGKGGHASNGGRGTIKKGDWNIYGLEWTPEEIVWTVNGQRTHSVKKQGDDPVKYPWTTPFYLMIDMQLGGSWVGAVDESTLPVAMHVDWVKFYQAYRNNKPVSELTWLPGNQQPSR